MINDESFSGILDSVKKTQEVLDKSENVLELIDLAKNLNLGPLEVSIKNVLKERRKFMDSIVSNPSLPVLHKTINSIHPQLNLRKSAQDLFKSIAPIGALYSTVLDKIEIDIKKLGRRALTESDALIDAAVMEDELASQLPTLDALPIDTLQNYTRGQSVCEYNFWRWPPGSGLSDQHFRKIIVREYT